MSASPTEIQKQEESRKESEEVEEKQDISSEATKKELTGLDLESTEAAIEGEQDNENSDGSESASQTRESSAVSSSSTTPQWQAVWSSQYNAYYFYNPATQETTWVNPLQQEAVTSTSSSINSDMSNSAFDVQSSTAGPSSGPGYLSTQQAHKAALEAAAIAQGIDPALAHLDPTLLTATMPGATASVDPSLGPTFTAKFNARTGQFAPASSRAPSHLSEYERAKRMSEFYFDVNKWEEDLAERGGSLMGEEINEEGGKKRKRPTKKDIERFKEQKRLKKIAKTAWLRT